MSGNIVPEWIKDRAFSELTWSVGRFVEALQELHRYRDDDYPHQWWVDYLKSVTDIDELVALEWAITQQRLPLYDRETLECIRLVCETMCAQGYNGGLRERHKEPSGPVYEKDRELADSKGYTDEFGRVHR